VEERLQKIMAQAGMGSRRACEELIAAGRVTVNGKVAILGTKADPATDRILVDHQVLKTPEALVYIAIYKPRGVLSSVSDPTHALLCASWSNCQGNSTRLSSGRG